MALFHRALALVSGAAIVLLSIVAIGTSGQQAKIEELRIGNSGARN